MTNPKKKLKFTSICNKSSCEPNDTVKNILDKFDHTNGRPLIVLTKTKHLFGIISSGDIRNYLTNSYKTDQDIYVGQICNKNPIFVKETDSNTVKDSWTYIKRN